MKQSLDTVKRGNGETADETGKSITSSPHAPIASSLNVAILYKRNANTDEYVMRLLEKQLGAHGHAMFVDRHMSIGVEWAAEIERKVRTADAVIVLISESAQYSEMLEFEVCTANEASLSGSGKPRILPVRVQFTGPIREPFAGILNPLQYTVWSGSDEDSKLVKDLDLALRNPPEKHARIKAGAVQPVGGAVPLDSEFYVERPTDHEFTAAIARRDSIVLVKGARQMGKTSLLARGLHIARDSGAKVALTDFQTLNVAHLESPDALYRILAESLADQLDLDVMPEEVWNPARGAKCFPHSMNLSSGGWTRSTGSSHARSAARYLVSFDRGTIGARWTRPVPGPDSRSR
jgi:hypothetical protein